MAKLEYTLIRSDRRSFSMQIKNGGLVVRAPLFASDRDVARFVSEHSDWAEKHLAKAAQTDELPRLTQAEIEELADRALEYIPPRVEYYAKLLGVTYNNITVRNQKTRWGSCSSKGNLNFNCLLMLTPPEIIDSVIVHELCHRKEMNHSERFYAEVLRVFPDYRRCQKWLRDNGQAIMRRMTG